MKQLENLGKNLSLKFCKVNYKIELKQMGLNSDLTFKYKILKFSNSRSIRILRFKNLREQRFINIVIHFKILFYKMLFLRFNTSFFMKY